VPRRRSFFYMAAGIHDTVRRLKFMDELSKSGGMIRNIMGNGTPVNCFREMNVGEIRWRNFLKLAEPPPCIIGNPHNANVMKTLLECEKTVYVIPTEEMDALLFQINLNPSLYKGLYKLPDDELHDIIPTSLLGYIFENMRFLDHVLRLPARIFVESGVSDQLNSMHIHKTRLNHLSSTRAALNNIPAFSKRPKALSLKTNAGIAFMIYITLVGLSLVSFLIEAVTDCQFRCRFQCMVLFFKMRLPFFRWSTGLYNIMIDISSRNNKFLKQATNSSKVVKM